MGFYSAYAAAPDDSGLGFIVICLALIGVVCGLALVPLAVAQRRSHKRAINMRIAIIVWAALTCGTLIYVTNAHLQWSKEYLTLIESGYWDPQDTSPAPRQPWGLWILLAVGYGGLLVWSRLPATTNRD
jgi:hypothetical protein